LEREDGNRNEFCSKNQNVLRRTLVEAQHRNFMENGPSEMHSGALFLLKYLLNIALAKAFLSLIFKIFNVISIF
jgi:hypothetical protein